MPRGSQKGKSCCSSRCGRLLSWKLQSAPRQEGDSDDRGHRSGDGRGEIAPQGVAQRTNSARNHKAKIGAVKRLTTLLHHSSRFAANCPTKKLKSTATFPARDAERATRRLSCRVQGTVRNRPRKSLVTTPPEECIPEARLNMAADRIAAMTIPPSPRGKTVATNLGRSSSACLTIKVLFPRALACCV